jgi:hypothetical protein
MKTAPPETERHADLLLTSKPTSPCVRPISLGVHCFTWPEGAKASNFKTQPCRLEEVVGEDEEKEPSPPQNPVDLPERLPGILQVFDDLQQKAAIPGLILQVQGVGAALPCRKMVIFTYSYFLSTIVRVCPKPV